MPSDLDVIRYPLNPTRFQCVYPTGRDTWRARVCKRINLGSFRSPTDAATAVVRWYREHYGPDWAAAFRLRKVCPWEINKTDRGHRAVVYVRGEPQEVIAGGEYVAPGGGTDWPTRAEAVAAAKAVAARLRGTPIPHPRVLLWRV